MFKEVPSVFQKKIKIDFKGVLRMFNEFCFAILFCTDFIAATRAEGGLVSFQ